MLNETNPISLNSKETLNFYRMPPGRQVQLEPLPKSEPWKKLI